MARQASSTPVFLSHSSKLPYLEACVRIAMGSRTAHQSQHVRHEHPMKACACVHAQNFRQHMRTEALRAKALAVSSTGL